MDALDSGDLHLQIQSAVALGRLREIGGPFQSLGKRLRVESDENVRVNLVVAIGTIGGPDARECLEEATKRARFFAFVADAANEELARFQQ